MYNFSNLFSLDGYSPEGLYTPWGKFIFYFQAGGPNQSLTSGAYPFFYRLSIVFPLIYINSSLMSVVPFDSKPPHPTEVSEKHCCFKAPFQQSLVSNPPVSTIPCFKAPSLESPLFQSPLEHFLLPKSRVSKPRFKARF